MTAADPLLQPTSTKLPLAVDLDGTLIHGDIFFESILRLVFAEPWKIALLLAWLMRGRAYAKAQLAERFAFDPASLPYDERVLTWLREQRASGRTIALATASDERAAQAIADHLGLFDAVFASDGATNLKASRKAERLAAAYPDGFVYAGNERADVAVWSAATGVVVANASSALTGECQRTFEVERTFSRRGDALAALVAAMRPQQWVKNLLVFLPMLAGQGWTQIEAWATAFIAFWALSFTASAVYLINDAADIDADRRHPRKKRRPLASGALAPIWGLAAAAILLALGLTLSTFVGVVMLTVLYFGATTLYSVWFKRVVLLDVFVLAGLYTIRILIGGAATGFVVSDWLLAFSCFFFLSLALVKRVAETRDRAGRGGGEIERRGYTSGDTNILTMMGISAGFISALVLALYLQDDAVTAHYREPFLLWGLPAIAVLWICRLWLKTHRGEMHDDPIVFAARDYVSWTMAAAGALCFAAAVYAPFGFSPAT